MRLVDNDPLGAYDALGRLAEADDLVRRARAALEKAEAACAALRVAPPAAAPWVAHAQAMKSDAEQKYADACTEVEDAEAAVASFVGEPD